RPHTLQELLRPLLRLHCHLHLCTWKRRSLHRSLPDWAVQTRTPLLTGKEQPRTILLSVFSSSHMTSWFIFFYVSKNIFVAYYNTTPPLCKTFLVKSGSIFPHLR